VDPYLIAELNTLIITFLAACVFAVGGLAGWLGHLAAARILRDEGASQKLRIDLYQQAVEPFLRLYTSGPFAGLGEGDWNNFELEMLRVASRLTLFAPQKVMNAFNEMVDYVRAGREGKVVVSDERTMQLGSDFLNTARKDIGLGAGRIAYQGTQGST
jgi:hypothetical protein